MLPSNPLDIILQHDKWSTDQLLLTCEKLSDDQLDRKFEMGPGSLRKIITHMISAMMAWTDTLVTRAQRPRLDQSGSSYSARQLTDFHEAAAKEFISISKAHPLDEMVTRTREGKEYRFSRAVVITQVTTHGMHHRAQCLNMLKQLGVNPLPKSSVTEWGLANG